MGNELDVAVIGYGLAGSAFHAPLIATTPGLRLSAVVTSDAAKATAARDRYPGITVLPSVAELWAHRPDVAVIATPNQTHVPLAKAALEHGIGVVVDKPLAPDPAQGEELIVAARVAGRPLTVYQNRRWDGDFRTVAELTRTGRLGRVTRFESRFERFRPTVQAGWKEELAPDAGGGILNDLGPHVIDQALQLFGPVDRVYAEVDTSRPGAAVDDDVFVALTHEAGVRSHLFVSAVAADLGPRFRVLGTSGGYSVGGLDGQEAALRAGEVPGPGWGETDEAGWGVLTDADGTHRIRTLPGDYPDFYRQLAVALLDGGPLPVDPADAVAALRIIAAARESSRSGAVVDL